MFKRQIDYHLVDAAPHSFPSLLRFVSVLLARLCLIDWCNRVFAHNTKSKTVTNMKGRFTSLNKKAKRQHKTWTTAGFSYELTIQSLVLAVHSFACLRWFFVTVFDPYFFSFRFVEKSPPKGDNSGLGIDSFLSRRRAFNRCISFIQKT